MKTKDEVLKEIKNIIHKWETEPHSESAPTLIDIKFELKELEEDDDVVSIDGALSKSMMTPEELKLHELPEPIGNFILNSEFEGIALTDGQYYHYSDVCTLLKRMKGNEHF